MASEAARHLVAVAGPDAKRIPLAEAALWIAAEEYPNLDVEAYVDRLDELAEVARRAIFPCAAEDRAARFNHFFFGELGFAGNSESYDDPRNSFLNDVLDRRQGIPITLSLVLMEVGKRLGLAIEGIGLPGHFIAGARLDDSQILLDPFNGGALLTPEDCDGLVGSVLGREVKLSPDHYAPVTGRQLLTRMLANLKAAYWRREEWEGVVGAIDRILALDPKAAPEWRDRGVAWSNLGEVRRGLGDWERYLTEFPDAEDHETVKGHLRRARQKLGQLN